jgi:hypothetical protein
MSLLEYTNQGPAAATVNPKPYLGKFQGWLHIILGLVMAGTVFAFLSGPNNRQIRAFAARFSQASDFGREILLRLDSGDVGGGLGMLTTYLLQTVGTGIGLLKKRAFGLVLLLGLAVRAVCRFLLFSWLLHWALCPTTTNGGVNFAYREIALALRL